MTSTDTILAIANNLETELHLDEIGHDSCHLASRLLLMRLAEAGCLAKRAACVTIAEKSDTAVVLCNDNATSLSKASCGHCVVIADSRDHGWILIDMTIGQVSDLHPFAGGRPDPIFAPIPFDPRTQPDGFQIAFKSDGFKFEYHCWFDHPIFNTALDWTADDEHINSFLDLIQDTEKRKLVRDEIWAMA